VPLRRAPLVPQASCHPHARRPPAPRPPPPPLAQDPLVEAACTAFATLDAMLLRVYAAVGVLFVAWALIELKHVAVGIWLRSGGGAASTDEELVAEGVPRAAAKGPDASARRELERAVLPLSA
jgi:hypothetical protein